MTSGRNVQGRFHGKRLSPEGSESPAGAFGFRSRGDIIADRDLYAAAQRGLGLWVIPSKGGEAHRVGVRARGIPSVNIHPDGRRIALTLGEYKAQLWVIQNLLLDPR